MKNLLTKEGRDIICLFGSMVTGNIHQNSDIDIGVRGLQRRNSLRCI
ncbi:MAG: nucleotidyltransferase domain-containing protein [Treponema sp.]|nr:nucleotidyltransferase domain-containing protein [Treponema sp.]